VLDLSICGGLHVHCFRPVGFVHILVLEDDRLSRRYWQIQVNSLSLHVHIKSFRKTETPSLQQSRGWLLGSEITLMMSSQVRTIIYRRIIYNFEGYCGFIKWCSFGAGNFTLAAGIISRFSGGFSSLRFVFYISFQRQFSMKDKLYLFRNASVLYSKHSSITCYEITITWSIDKNARLGQV
jgi:hypothetical protein